MKRSKLWLLLIFVFAFFLRIYRLDHLELFGDELDVGYHAYSLWTTGRDYMGQKLPVYIHSFAEWRAPLLMYVTAPFVGIFGLNEWGVRLPQVVLGIVNIFLFYLLVKTLTKNEKLSLVSAFILAIVPWHIHYSRIAFEVTLLLNLIFLGTLTFLKKHWWASAASFGLTFYTYSTANVFVPLWILALCIARQPKERAKSLIMKAGNIFSSQTRKFITPSLIFIILVFPVLLTTFQGQSSARFKLISIFSDFKIVEQIILKRTTGVNPKTERIFHNKLTGWGKGFVSNYLTAFSPQFLFLSGDPNPRHNSPGFGEFFWVLLPFLIIGIWRLAKSKDKLFSKLIFTWLFLAPLASSLTVGGGNQATRLFLMIPPLATLIALGVENFMASFWKFLFLTTVLISLFFWLHGYFVHYPKEQYRYWHYGYKEAIGWLKDNEESHQRVIVNNSHEPVLLRYLFWAEKDPRWFWERFFSDETKKEVLPGFEGFSLGDKVFFGNIVEDGKQQWLENTLTDDDFYLAFQKDEVPGDWNWEKEPPGRLKILKTVYDPWGNPLMYWIAGRNKN